MKILADCFDRKIRLTDERLAHIVEHPELAGMESEIERVLQRPAQVRRSRSDPDAFLFYVFYPQRQ